MSSSTHEVDSIIWILNELITSSLLIRSIEFATGVSTWNQGDRMPRGRPTRASVYARLDASLHELRDRLGGLPSPEEAGFVWRDIWHL